MTEKTLKLLEESGWTKNRNIDITNYESILKEEGYFINDIVREFLQSFGGVKVIHPHHHVETSKDEFYIDPIQAISKVYIETVKEYEDRVNESLAVVGMCFREHMVMLISNNGKMYAGYDETLLKLGDTTTQGLIALCEGTGITGV